MFNQKIVLRKLKIMFQIINNTFEITYEYIKVVAFFYCMFFAGGFLRVSLYYNLNEEAIPLKSANDVGSG